MALGNFVSNQGTQTGIIVDTIGTSVMAIQKLDISPLGSDGTIWGGNVGVTGGTINTIGTLPNLLGGTLTNLVSGTINSATVTGNVGVSSGTINLGTAVLNSGTINVGTFVMPSGTLTTGTILSSGTTTGVGSVSSLGSLGMLNAGTISMINAGTLTSITGNVAGLSTGTINVGTFVNNGGTVAVVQNAGTLQVGANIIGNIGTLVTGTILSSGTSTGVGTLTNAGSVTNLGQVYNAGTIQNILGGTVQTSAIPNIAIPTFGTHGTTGVSIFGTLAGGTGSGAGTEIFVTRLSLSIPSTGGSQDVSIGWGTNGGTFHAGTGLLVRGNFPPGGGIVVPFIPANNSGTNSQLCYFQAGAGTVDISASYFITPSTL